MTLLRAILLSGLDHIFQLRRGLVVDIFLDLISLANVAKACTPFERTASANAAKDCYKKYQTSQDRVRNFVPLLELFLSPLFLLFLLVFVMLDGLYTVEHLLFLFRSIRLLHTFVGKICCVNG